jgi:hypothetical protein
MRHEPEFALRYATPADRSSFLATKKPRRAGLSEVGGTGLEPVTPSLSSMGDRLPVFAAVRYIEYLSLSPFSGPNGMERERTPSAAIAAMRLQTVDAAVASKSYATTPALGKPALTSASSCSCRRTNA